MAFGAGPKRSTGRLHLPFSHQNSSRGLQDEKTNKEKKKTGRTIFCDPKPGFY